MDKNNYSYQNFLSCLNVNLKFMLQLEKQAIIKNDKLYTLVPMHKLSEHVLISKHIKYYRDLIELDEKILSDKFYFYIKFVDTNEKQLEVCGAKVKNQQYFILYDLEIKTIKIKYLLLYDAASSQHKKKAQKILIDDLQ